MTAKWITIIKNNVYLVYDYLTSIIREKSSCTSRKLHNIIMCAIIILYVCAKNVFKIENKKVNIQPEIIFKIKQASAVQK